MHIFDQNKVAEIENSNFNDRANGWSSSIPPGTITNAKPISPSLSTLPGDNNSPIHQREGEREGADDPTPKLLSWQIDQLAASRRGGGGSFGHLTRMDHNYSR